MISIYQCNQVQMPLGSKFLHALQCFVYFIHCHAGWSETSGHILRDILNKVGEKGTNRIQPRRFS